MDNSQQTASRRNLLKIGALGVAGVGLPLISQNMARSEKVPQSDIKVLNSALFYENQAIWAYGFAAGKLTQSDLGTLVLAIALANQADHKTHRDLLTQVITDLGGTPVKAEADYLKTVKPYLEKGEGNIDSDVNIAKLALALEVDAAIAYGVESAKFKTPALIMAGSSIGSTEASHATLIRAAFKALGVDLRVIPASFVNADTRSEWILKVL